MGNSNIEPSYANASPAPREIHTEYPRVLSPASLGSFACFILDSGYQQHSTY